MARQIGAITAGVIKILGLEIVPGTSVFIGETNINHMKKSHPADYERYGDRINIIIDSPDYVGINPKDSSIEYVKEFVVDGEHVKVAVRVTGSGAYFARSLYVLNPNRVRNFVEKGSLKPLTG